MCPTDKDCYFRPPNLVTPKYDEVHISVTFTWDKEKAYRLAIQWRKYGKVRIGGVAIDGESDQPFKAGIYLKPEITITSRGCPFYCWFCMTKNKLIEFDEFPKGNIIQDNNFLATSRRHQRLVFDMLRNQKQIEFKGGLDKRLLTSDIAKELRELRIKSLWLACDSPQDLKSFKKAISILQQAGFTRHHLYCYVLIGKDMNEEEKRMKEIFNIGAIPFAQLYRDPQNNIKYSKDWKHFQRQWSRPAIIKAIMNEN